MSNKNNTNNNEEVTLLIVTSPSCSACKNFKKTDLPSLLKSKIKNKVNVVHIDHPSKLAGIHPDLQYIVAWFPFFILVNTKSLINAKSQLNGVVVGGAIVEKTVKGKKIRTTVQNGVYSYNSNKVSKWVEDNYQNNILLDNYEISDTPRKSKYITVRKVNSKKVNDRYKSRTNDFV